MPKIRKPQLTTDEKKAMFLFTLPLMLWNVSKACDAVDISRATFYVWIKEDPQFAENIDTAREERIDFLQEKSLELVSTLDGPQIRFELTALGKSRGYGKLDSDRPPLPPSQHLHFHLPPQPASLADWEQQTIEARKARVALEPPIELKPVNSIKEQATERVKGQYETPADVLNAHEGNGQGNGNGGNGFMLTDSQESADSGEDEEEGKDG